MSEYEHNANAILEYVASLIHLPPRVASRVCTGTHCDMQRCYETHYLGSGPPDSNVFAGDEPLSDYRYELFGTWNIHAERYERMEAFFHRLLDGPRVVDVSQALAIYEALNAAP